MPVLPPAPAAAMPPSSLSKVYNLESGRDQLSCQPQCVFCLPSSETCLSIDPLSIVPHTCLSLKCRALS